MLRPVTDVLVKPAGPDCNLACGYCFYSGKERLFPGSKMRMNDEVLESMVSQLMAQPVEQLSIGWQGGEPTLMGVPFYRKALRLMQHYGKGMAVANGLQTNGVLIDRDWSHLFKEFHFLVGLSIDGPEHIHDHYRRTRSEKGSFLKAADAAKLLLDQGVEVNALTVVNDYSGQFPEEIYEFHKSLGLNFMQFIPCIETDSSGHGCAGPYSVSGGMYRDFLCKLFDLWLADFSHGVPTTSIRFFESLLFKYAGFPATECTLTEECGSYVVVEHSGDVYACDLFVEPGWKLGNLCQTQLVLLLNSPRQKEFGRLKANLPGECLACEWKELCRGGCTKDRIRDPAGNNRNHFCSAFKAFFSHADTRFRRLAEDWKRKQHGQTAPLRRSS